MSESLDTHKTFAAFNEAFETQNIFTEFVNKVGVTNARKAMLTFSKSRAYELTVKFLEQVESVAFVKLRTIFPKESEKIAAMQSYALFREAFVDFVEKMCGERVEEDLSDQLLKKLPSGNRAI